MNIRSELIDFWLKGHVLIISEISRHHVWNVTLPNRWITEHNKPFAVVPKPTMQQHNFINLHWFESNEDAFWCVQTVQQQYTAECKCIWPQVNSTFAGQFGLKTLGFTGWKLNYCPDNFLGAALQHIFDNRRTRLDLGFLRPVSRNCCSVLYTSLLHGVF